MKNFERPQAQAAEPSFAHRLEHATSDAERETIWRQYITGNPYILLEDTVAAQRLISGGDLDGLKTHLGRHSSQRAAAHIALINATSGDTLPPAT